MRSVSKQEAKVIEQALSLLVAEINRHSSNPKPVIWHSVKVGKQLFDLGAPIDFVVAGFLHDLLEDSRCSILVIERKFGPRVGKIVSAMTMDYSYRFPTYEERWYDAMRRLKKVGKFAILLKVIDCYDNLPYYHKKVSKLRFKEMMWKHKLVVKTASQYWPKLSVFQQYRTTVKQVINGNKLKLQ